MPYIITEACINVKDRACVDVCPVDCIYEGEQQINRDIFKGPTPPGKPQK